MTKIEMLKELQSQIDYLASWTEDAPITPRRLSDVLQATIEEMERKKNA